LVSNLSFNLTKDHVEEILGEFGKTTSVQMKVSRNMNNFKKNDGEGKNDTSNANSKTENGDNDVKSMSVGGIMDVDESSSTAVINSVKKQLSCQQAIVEYESVKDAENAIKGMSGGVIDGCLVTVTLATINDLKSENAAYSTGFSALNRRPSKPNPAFNNDAERRRMQSKRVPSPYGRRPPPSSRRSPSPAGRRPGPPSRRRSPPPYRRGPRRRSPSPYTRRNRSPLRKRSLSPSRSPPIRKRSRTPPTKKEQQPAPIRSFVNPERLKNMPV
jgi:RNA recognition motif-containing protein